MSYNEIIEIDKKFMTDGKLKIGGLFSGVGGIELGFKQTGHYETLWANEIDDKACKTFRLNFPDVNLIEDDIRNLKGDELPKVDVLVGGFPCQAFSIAGYRKGFEDERGNLFFEIMRLIKEMEEKPKVLLLENVKNIINHDQGNTFKVIKDFLEHFGYSFFYEVLNTAEYTKIPQNRERAYFVCFRDEYNWKENFSSNLERTCSFNFSKIFPPQVINKRHHVQDLLENNEVDDKFYYKEDWHKYNKLKEKMKSRDTVYQWRRVYVRENQSDMCPTLTANMGTGGHNVPLIIDDFGFRKLTPRECFRFQGFPETYKLPEDLALSHLYKQAGNSVTVCMIELIAESIYQSINEAVIMDKEEEMALEDS